MIERVIPDRANRTIWWLIALTLLGVSLTGPVITAIVLPRVFERPVLPAIAMLVAVNLAVMILVVGTMTIVLRRPGRLSAGRAIANIALVTAAATAFRLLTLSTWKPENGWLFAALQVVLAVLFIAFVSTAILYGSRLERTLDAAYSAHARTQTALLHEEESVRAQVFDQLHGNLQAEFVAMRRILDNLADRTTDPDAAATARAMDGRLEVVYRRGVETIARALSPAGIEAGLLPALRELQVRVGDAIAVEVHADPIVLVLDDPTTGGMRRPVRLAAYRVVEEAVSNASRHSRAASITVRISSTLRDGQPQLMVHASNPSSAREEFTEGQGLTRMRSRVDTLGGDVRIMSTSDAFTVSARLPLQVPAGS